MAETLLDKARNSGKRKKSEVTAEELELAISWLQEEVTTAQVAIAYNLTQQSNCLYRIALALRIAYRNKMISVKE